jgi:beta-glucosidase
MQTIAFPKGFLWGAATAAYQIEGSAAADGRGPSIRDRFSHTEGKVRDGDTGDVACDHYRRWAEDVGLMTELGLNAYRFSISWSRVLPEGKGRLNPAGLAFYDRLVDALLEKGIEPSATLYHWDLPQATQDEGGWANRDIVGRFADYSALMYDKLGDRVPRWYTHNEPWVVAYAGHLQGRHAPGIADLKTAVAVSHHLLLSHAAAVEAFRTYGRSAANRGTARGGEIGIVLNLYPCVPASASATDTAATQLADQHHNRWFLDPIYRGSYPAELFARFEAAGAAPPIHAGDLERIASAKTDFLGVNYYFRKVVAACEAGAPEMSAASAPPAAVFAEVKPKGAPYTQIGWEVWPAGLTDLLLRLKADYGDPRLFVTENGAAFGDATFQANGEVDDEDRRSFLEGHFRAAAEAIAAGARLEGFFVWSLLDNFEWAQGYSKRFGLIRVDYPTQKRIWKKSARWYRKVIAANGIEE